MARGAYLKHRAGQEQAILEAAEELFTSRGIGQVKMSDIAAVAGMTKPTLYKYFAGKEEMAVRIFQNIARNWAGANREKVWTGKGTGWESVERFILFRFTHAVENMKEISFWAEFEILYARRWSVDKGMEIIKEHLEPDRLHLMEALARGQKDGSVRTDRKPEDLSSAVLSFNSALFLRLGLFREKLEGEFNLSLIELHLTLCRVFLDGMKPEE